MEELDALRKQWKLQDMEGDLPGLPGRDEVAWGSGFLRVLRTEVRLNIILSILLGAALAIGHSTPFLGGLMTLFLLSLLSLAFYYRMQRTVLSLADPTAEVMTHVGQLRKGLKFLRRTYLLGGLLLANLMFLSAAITAFLLLSRGSRLITFIPDTTFLMSAAGALLLVNVLTIRILFSYYQKNIAGVEAQVDRWHKQLND